MNKLSLCCQDEMIEGGQCLCCGANGLTEEECHEIEQREIDERKEYEENVRPDKI